MVFDYLEEEGFCSSFTILSFRPVSKLFVGLEKLKGCPGTKCGAHTTLTLLEQMFQMAHLLMTENNCANLC